MDTIGLDLHKRESQLCIGRDDGSVAERRIVTSRERFTADGTYELRAVELRTTGRDVSILHDLKLRFSPPRLTDPDFGELLFMYIAAVPERSYWECANWRFAPTGTEIGIDLPGGEAGPLPEGRRFYLGLQDEFPRVLELARPALDRVFRNWYQRPVADDLWQDVKLAGFGLEDPRAKPLEWQMYFESTGAKWLGIVIPFRGDAPGAEVVDT